MEFNQAVNRGEILPIELIDVGEYQAAFTSVRRIREDFRYEERFVALVLGEHWVADRIKTGREKRSITSLALSVQMPVPLSFLPSTSREAFTAIHPRNNYGDPRASFTSEEVTPRVDSRYLISFNLCTSVIDSQTIFKAYSTTVIHYLLYRWTLSDYLVLSLFLRNLLKINLLEFFFF